MCIEHITFLTKAVCMQDAHSLQYSDYSLTTVHACILHAVLRGRDPSAVAVLMEDSAAVAGVFVAATALGITHWTGNTMYDAIGHRR